MIARLGFFRFIADGNPLCLLEDALSSYGDSLPGSLVVLPEAVNYGKTYYLYDKDAPMLPPGDAARKLAALSRAYGVVFVAGLLDRQCRCNSAYLIRSQGEPALMRHKTRGDCTQSYDACEAPCGKNPINSQDACIGALICNEAECHAAWLAQELDRHAGPRRKVICIPASMTSTYLSGDSLDSAPWFSGKYYTVLANSRPCPDGTKSFITNKRGLKAPDSEPHGGLFLKPWHELDSLGE